MKVLKVIEKVCFIVAVSVAVFAVALGGLLDGEVAGLPEVMNALFGALGLGVVLAFILIGAFLYFVKEHIARKVGTGLLLAAFVLIFACALDALMNESEALSPIFGLVAGVLMMVAFLLRFIRWIVRTTKSESGEEGEDPMADPKVRLILKWKSLLDQGVITKEEYELKRKEIVTSIDKKPGK